LPVERRVGSQEELQVDSPEEPLEEPQADLGQLEMQL